MNIYVLDKLKSFSPPRTLCQASSQNRDRKTFGVQVPVFFQILGTLSSVSQIVQNSAPPQTLPSQTIDLGTFLASILSFWRCLLASFCFCTFHNSPTTVVLQHVSSDTLVLTFQTRSFRETTSIQFFFSGIILGNLFHQNSNRIANNVISGPCSGSSWVQNGTPHRPSSAKKLCAHIWHS